MPEQHDLKTPAGRYGHIKQALDDLKSNSGSVLGSFHQTLIKSNRGYYLEIDADSKITKVSANVFRFLNIDPANVIGTRLSNIIGQPAITETLNEIKQFGVATKDVEFMGKKFTAVAWKLPDSDSFGEYLFLNNE